MKQGHYTFVNKEDAEDFASLYGGKVIPDSYYPCFHVWIELEDKEAMIDMLIQKNAISQREISDMRVRVAKLESKLKRIKIISNIKEE